MPEFDTLGLHRIFAGDDHNRRQDLEREIVLTLLAAPRPICFPSLEELWAAVRIRCNIVEAASKTQLAFDTSAAAERPSEYWTYAEDTGFTILPGRSLIEGLVKATQPDASGKLYAFSCYRATEYVTLLGIAQELERTNPALLQRLQAQWETQAIMADRFYDVFLQEYGSMDDPVPARYYVPGDRVWFRNPDEHSTNVEGYEGSWVLYLGRGLFSNFWKREQPFTIEAKCIEIFHWRHGVYRNDRGELGMDESVVERLVEETLANPMAKKAIMDTMFRMRDRRGVYADGGCIDCTRDFPRWVSVWSSGAPDRIEL